MMGLDGAADLTAEFGSSGRGLVGQRPCAEPRTSSGSTFNAPAAGQPASTRTGGEWTSTCTRATQTRAPGIATAENLRRIGSVGSSDG